MPGGTIQLDPVVIGDDREEERREAARAALARMMPAGSLDGIEVADPRPDAHRERVADLPELPPLSPDRGVPPHVERQAAEAQRLGDAWRASMRAEPAPSQPMGPLARPGESAAVMSQAAPETPPVDRERLRAALQARQGQPAGAPVPPTPAPARAMQMEPVVIGGLSPADAARMDRIASLRAPHPDAEVYGMASDDDPELPGNIRPGGADPNAEIWGEASDSDPVLPGRIRPGADPNAEIYGEATDADPVLPGRIGPGARPSQSLGDPTQTLLPDRERLQQLLRARQAPRSSPSASPAGAPEPTAPVRDFTGADWHDAIRRPLHGIGNALRAAAGMGATPFRSERAELEQRFAREDAANATAAQRERAAASADRDASMAERRMALQERSADTQAELGAERNRISREMQAGRLDVSRERAESSRQQAEITGQLAQARLAGIQDENAREAAALNPASEPSQIARLSLSAALAGYPPAARARLAQQMGVDEAGLDEALSGLNMRQAEQLRDDLPSMFRDTTNRRGGLGGSGGSAPPVDDTGLRAAAVNIGIGEAVADGYLARGVRGRRELEQAVAREQMRRARGGGEAEAGTEIMPGVRTSLELPASEAQALRNSVATAASSAANLRALGEIERRYGGVRARISPEAQAEITPRLTVARGMVAQLGNTGVINPSEVPAINAALPDPGNLGSMTFGTFGSRMRAWQRMLEDTVRTSLAARGVDDEGIERALQPLRTGSFGEVGPRRPAPAADGVRVRHPDGRTGTIPRARLEAAREAGFEEVR